MPTLVDGKIVVVNSADIVAYLEHRYPERPVYPKDPAAHVRARAWERCADTVVDPILVDISYWIWAKRDDQMPDGMKAAAQDDLNSVYHALERDLNGRNFICGDFSIADIALFPHLTAVRLLGVSFSERYVRVAAWFKRMREIDVCSADLARTKAYVDALSEHNIERQKIFWRGDRIEWILARGFHDWFIGEIKAGRATFPGLGIPGAADAPLS